MAWTSVNAETEIRFNAQPLGWKYSKKIGIPAKQFLCLNLPHLQKIVTERNLQAKVPRYPPPLLQLLERVEVHG
jgi:hypothetical protein